MVERRMGRLRCERLRRAVCAFTGREGPARARWLPVGQACTVGLLGALCLAVLASFAGARAGRSLDESLLNFFNQQASKGTLLQFADLVNRSVAVIAPVWCAALVIVTLKRLRDRTSAFAVLALVVGAGWRARY